eukprot:CFRG6743T1
MLLSSLRRATSVAAAVRAQGSVFTFSRAYAVNPYEFALPTGDNTKASSSPTDDIAEISPQQMKAEVKYAQMRIQDQKRHKAELAVLRVRLGGKLSPHVLRQCLTFEEAESAEENNDQLVLLGRCVYGLYVMEHIATVFPNFNSVIQKDITEFVLHRETLASRAKAFGIPSLMQYKTIDKKEVTTQKGIANVDIEEEARYSADALRAVAGALYVTASPDDARQFVRETVLYSLQNIDLRDKIQITSPMKAFQKIASLGTDGVEYRVLNEAGRVSYQPTFHVGVFKDGKNIGTGAGHSIREAKKEASRQAVASHICETPNSRNIKFPSDIGHSALPLKCTVSRA